MTPIPMPTPMPTDTMPALARPLDAPRGRAPRSRALHVTLWIVQVLLAAFVAWGRSTRARIAPRA